MNSSGLWILLLAPYLAGLPATILRYLEFVRVGVPSQTGVVTTLAYVVASVAAIGPRSPQTRDAARAAANLALLYIGAFPVSFSCGRPMVLPDGPLRDTALPLFSPAVPPHIAAIAVIIIAVSSAQSRRAEPGPPRQLIGDASRSRCCGVGRPQRAGPGTTPSQRCD